MILSAVQLKRACFGSILILLIACSYAPASINPTWLTRVWQTDDGLPDNNVPAIVQGNDNYLWVVTPVGLARFDGINFSPFPIEDFTELPVPHVRNVLSSRSGVLWVASDGGTVVGLNPDFSTIPFPLADLPKHIPHSLAESADGSLWLGYVSETTWAGRTNNIYRLKNGKVTCFTAEDGVPPGTFYSLISDGKQNIWVAKGNKIIFFKNGLFHEAASLPGVRCLGGADTNAVWFVAGTHLFNCNTGETLWDCGGFQKLSGSTVTVLLEDREGAVWIGTDGNGLFRYSKSGLESIETSHSSILSLAQDREGNIWAGTAGGGLDRICSRGVRLETFDNNQVPSQLLSICQDTRGVLWGATQNGVLVCRMNDRWKPEYTNAPFAGTVTCVAADCDSTIWVGTRDGKVWHIAATNYVKWDTLWEQNSAISPSIRMLLPISKGNLWIAGASMADIVKDGHLQQVKLPTRLRSISAIAEDASGNIWIGANGSLVCYNGQDFINETPELRIFNHPVCCLCGTADGSMWLGTRGGGLLRFKNGHFDQIGTERGLFNNYISQISPDRRGWLWFGSDHGIFKLRQRELEQAFRDKTVRLQPVVYGRNEGLISLEAVFSTAPPFVIPNAILAEDGRVWMLMYTGVAVADPKLLPENLGPPPVLITEVVKDEQTIASYGGVPTGQTIANLKARDASLRLPPSYWHLEFDFTAFNFSAPENLCFRYHLEGFDNGWIDATTERHADYSRLTAGNYQFRVESRIGDGPWSKTPATLAFTVAPFFWQTWWFRLGIFSFFTLSLIAIVRFISIRRMRLKLLAIEQQAAVERERGRIARDIHDDLGNRLTEIQLLTGLAERNRTPDKVIAQIHGISFAAQQATDALDEIVWAINPRNDTLPHLVNYLGEFTSDFLRTAGLICRMELPQQVPAISVSSEVRHNLFLAVKESLNNIVNHANATEVFMRIVITDESASIIVGDNGRGFSETVKNNGADGLENMRHRIADIGGELQIKTSPTAGTVISFICPWTAGS